MIAVFTKYDQFKRDVMRKLEDQHRDTALLNNEMERIFGEYYLANLGSPPFVCLESKGIVNKLTCTMLISVVQKCTKRASNVQNLLRQLPMHFIVMQLHSYSCQYRRVI